MPEYIFVGTRGDCVLLIVFAKQSLNLLQLFSECATGNIRENYFQSKGLWWMIQYV